MPGLAPGIVIFAAAQELDVDGRDKPGHDWIGRRAPGRMW
jgi:hypothetical protein